MSVGWCNTYEGRKVSRVAMCEVRSRKNNQEQKKKKKSIVVSSKKKLTIMNPIRRRMKKRNPSSGQNGQLVHWWLLIHSGRCFEGGLEAINWNLPNMTFIRICNTIEISVKSGKDNTSTPSLVIHMVRFQKTCKNVHQH